MLTKRKILIILFTMTWMILLTTPSFARGVSMKDAGSSLWVLFAIGAVIILLQLIPATILFFSFIGSVSAIAFRQKRVSGKEGMKEAGRMTLPGYEPIPVEKR